jgi:hypothetical protein
MLGYLISRAQDLAIMKRCWVKNETAGILDSCWYYNSRMPWEINVAHNSNRFQCAFIDVRRGRRDWSDNYCLWSWVLSDLHDLRPNAWSIARDSWCAYYYGQLNTPEGLKAAGMIDAPQLLSTPPPHQSNWTLMLLTNRAPPPQTHRFFSATPSLSAECVRWCLNVRKSGNAVPSVWTVSFHLILSTFIVPSSFPLVIFSFILHLYIYIYIYIYIPLFNKKLMRSLFMSYIKPAN